MGPRASSTGRTRARRRVVLACALLGLTVLVAADQAPSKARKDDLLILQVDQGQKTSSGTPLTSVATQDQKPGEKKPLQSLPITQIDERRRGQELEEGRAFSLSFSEPIPIKELLLLLVKDTNVSIIPDPDVEGTFIGDLKTVTLRQAFDLILPPLGLDYSVQDNFIKVFKRKTVTRIFDINLVITKRSGSRALAATTAAGGGAAFGGAGAGFGGIPIGAAGVAGGAGAAGGSVGGSSASVSGQDTGDLFGELEGGIKNLLSDQGKYNLDRKAGLLQVTDYPDRLDRITLYLDAVQGHAQRQVQIQARVIEVVLRDEFSSGIDWSTIFRTAPSSIKLTQKLSPATAGAFTLGITIGDFQGLLSAFATQGKVNVLSSPKVVAMNNEPAIIRVGTQDVFFVTTTQVDATTGRILQTSTTPQSITEGVVLSVTPQVSADGVITLSVNPSVTERTGQATSRFGDTVPIVSVRETDTIVRVHEGETAVIGGLMQDKLTVDKSKVPLLGDVPIVGGLFRRDEKRKQKTDLVVLLTPTLLTPARVNETADRDRDRLEMLRKREKP